MQKKGANISLKGYDDIFSTDQSRAEAQQERVQEIPLSELHPFEGHPFRVVDDEEMMKTVESVRDFGVLTPAIVRPDPYGGYEIISGHRRHRASELAGKETMNEHADIRKQLEVIDMLATFKYYLQVEAQRRLYKVCSGRFRSRTSKDGY